MAQTLTLLYQTHWKKESVMKRTIINLILQLVIAGMIVQANAQTSTYKDVVVVINGASPISDSIGTYFAQRRNISNDNIVRITAPTTEEIDSVQFENMRSQIESILISRNLKDSINYIVTTKGMPLKVKRSMADANSSVESELTLILGPYASSIGNNGRIISPYYGKRDNFTRSKYGIYLVTRLDGYTFTDIKGIIDRASSIPATIPTSAMFVLDMDPTKSLSHFLNTNMQRVADSLNVRGLTTNLDATTAYLTTQSNVLGYASWGSNDANCQLYTTNAKPMNTYLPGAIAETYVSTSARSFSTPAVYGQSLIADLISEGVTAAKGYVYEPYSNAMADVNILFPMYTNGFTVAESFYASSYFLGWMDVVIGDPKYRIVSTRVPQDAVNLSSPNDGSQLPVEMTSFTTAAQKMAAQLKWNTATEVNNYGFEIERRVIASNAWAKVGFVSGSGTSNTAHSYTFADNNLSAGKYAYRLKQIDNDGAFKYSNSTEVTIVGVAKELKIFGNYPNPFNPSTKVQFAVPENGNVSLRVYNVIGQEVATLFNGAAEAGNLYTANFDGSHMASGLYFSVLEYGNQRVTNKMMMTK